MRDLFLVNLCKMVKALNVATDSMDMIWGLLMANSSDKVKYI